MSRVKLNQDFLAPNAARCEACGKVRHKGRLVYQRGWFCKVVADCLARTDRTPPTETRGDDEGKVGP